MDEKGNQNNELEEKDKNVQINEENAEIEQKPQNFKYKTEEGFIICKSLNSSNDKLIIKVDHEQAKKSIYLKEYTFKQITKECPIFTLEEKLEDIDKLISESINNYGAHCLIDDNDENKLNLIIQLKINSKLKEIKIPLDKTDLSEKEYISSLVEKVNDLVNERRQILKMNHKETGKTKR